MSLFPFYRFEQGLEVAFAKGLCTFALDDFKEEGWSVLNRFGKQLQQITAIVPVD